ncbi:MAG: methanethiol S-methyltransferase [Bdellovibrio bacteriovorus]
MFKRISVFFYGVVSYAIFFATFLYAIGFVGNLWVPKSVDSVPQTPLWVALLVDSLLLGIFAVQHSVMARPGFKRWITRFIPRAAERSTYTLVSSLLLIVLFAWWQPIGGVIWNVEDPFGKAVLYSLFAFGWGLVLVATFLINHFDLFGLRQVWLYLIGKDYTHLKFGTPGPYKWVRHPLYVGWFFAFWATPTMTIAHLVFALLATGYILIAIQLEERDLIDVHPEYAGYRKRVPMLIPRFKGAAGPASPVSETA